MGNTEPGTICRGRPDVVDDTDMSEPRAKREPADPESGSSRPPGSAADPSAEALYDELGFDSDGVARSGGAAASPTRALAGDAAGDGASGARGFSCASCHTGITDQYFAINGNPVCAGCFRTTADAARVGNARPGRALLLGSLAAAAGSALYYAIAALTGYELGIIAIVIGIGVGKAVRRGAGLSAHWTYRALAVALTWMSIASTTVPSIFDAMGPDASGPSALAIALCLGALSPFLLLVEGQFMSVIILAIGLWEGWRYSAAPRVSLEGPFRVGAGPAPAAANAS